MKKNILPIALASTLLVAACSPDSITSAGKDDSEKTPIEFSMTDNTSAAVAVNGNTRAGFTAETGIVMQMVATDNSSSSTSKTTTTTAKAAAAAETVQYSSVTFESGNIRYWDDAYGRNTKLSIYAVAVPNKTIGDNSPLSKLGGEAEDANSWGTSSSNSLSWTLTTDNAITTEKLAEQDLVYSNNIQETQTDYNKVNGVYRYNFTENSYPEYSATGLTAGQMLFALKTTGVTDGPGKFDKGNLNFVHALSRVTIKVKYGTNSGFGDNDKISDATLISQPYKGTFDVKTGTFSAFADGDKSNVVMATGSLSEDGVKGYFQGQVLPGSEITKESTSNFLSFKIGDNVYYVTQGSVYSALATTDNQSKLGSAYTENKITMTQGQNYVLTITVSKTGINNLTATLADWTAIEGKYDRDNAYLTFDFANYGGTTSNNFDLYRLADDYTDPQTSAPTEKHYNWLTGYSNGKANSVTSTTTDSKTTFSVSNWYWDSNKAFYHFRMVGKGSDASATGPEIKSDGEDTNKSDYFEIKSGTSDGNYRWGAPMASGTDKKLTYDKDKKGFDGTSTTEGAHDISEAIGATQSTIHFTEVNTLAKIVVKLTTSTDDSKVTFKEGETKTKVELMNIYTEGKVYMGNGLVKPSGNRATNSSTMTANDDANEFNYFVVPQALVDNGETKTYVAFKITTPDGNVYYVKEKLSEIKATSNTNGTNSSNVSIGQQNGTAIDYWYPNCTYTYTFTVKKTGIDKFTATLVPYTEIEGTNTDISLED